MTERVCVPYGESEDTLPTEYSIYGILDVDDLLAKAKPKGKITVWRENDDTEFGRATTSGITVSSSMAFRGRRSFER